MDKKRLQKYAELVVKCGLNVQKGQEVIIRCGLDQPDFVTMCVEECYKCGAERVKVEWSYMPVSKLGYKYRSLETLSEFTAVEKAEWERKVEKLTCLLWLDSDDPDGLNGTDSEKISKANQARYPFIKPYRDALENKYQWCIAAVPGKEWAQKIFPELSAEAAIEALWENILLCSRVYADNDPVKAWKTHNENLAKRCEFLNKYKFDRLEYKSANGTDFTVGLNPIGIFMGATKALSYQGKLIENFWVRFKDGKVVETYAEKNGDLLKKMVSMDEGAAYLGECALIAYDSPINNTGVLFYNTLFDENASCHLALGRGFNNCLENYENYSVEECEKLGINSSMIHVDFMIGSKDMCITGITKDGERVAIFKDGNWAI